MQSWTPGRIQSWPRQVDNNNNHHHHHIASGSHVWHGRQTMSLEWLADYWLTVICAVNQKIYWLSYDSLLCLWLCTQHTFLTWLLCPDLCREGALWIDGRCLSVDPSVCRVPQPNWRTKRPRKLKIGIMEANHRSNPWSSREPIKRSKG